MKGTFDEQKPALLPTDVIRREVNKTRSALMKWEINGIKTVPPGVYDELAKLEEGLRRAVVDNISDSMCKVLEGMNIIAKYEPEARLTMRAAGEVNFGTFHPNKMSRADSQRLSELIWYYDDQPLGWYRYVRWSDGMMHYTPRDDR